MKTSTRIIALAAISAVHLAQAAPILAVPLAPEAVASVPALANDNTGGLALSRLGDWSGSDSIDYMLISRAVDATASPDDEQLWTRGVLDGEGVVEAMIDATKAEADKANGALDDSATSKLSSLSSLSSSSDGVGPSAGGIRLLRRPNSALVDSQTAINAVPDLKAALFKTQTNSHPLVLLKKPLPPPPQGKNYRGKGAVKVWKPVANVLETSSRSPAATVPLSGSTAKLDEGKPNSGQDQKLKQVDSADTSKLPSAKLSEDQLRLKWHGKDPRQINDFIPKSRGLIRPPFEPEDSLTMQHERAHSSWRDSIRYEEILTAKLNAHNEERRQLEQRLEDAKKRTAEFWATIAPSTKEVAQRGSKGASVSKVPHSQSFKQQKQQPAVKANSDADLDGKVRGDDRSSEIIQQKKSKEVSWEGFRSDEFYNIEKEFKQGRLELENYLPALEKEIERLGQDFKASDIDERFARKIKQLGMKFKSQQDRNAHRIGAEKRLVSRKASFRAVLIREKQKLEKEVGSKELKKPHREESTSTSHA